MKRHPLRLLGRTDDDSMRMTGFEQRTDGEAQLVYAIRFEKRGKQCRTAFAEDLPESALRKRVEHDTHVEFLLSAHEDLGHARERFLLLVR